jgi:hypothetical protein
MALARPRKTAMGRPTGMSSHSSMERTLASSASRPYVGSWAVPAGVSHRLQRSIPIYDRSGVIAELETALQADFGVRHAVLTSSGTAALHSTYVAADIGPGDGNAVAAP